jgi:hypothetical protein
MKNDVTMKHQCVHPQRKKERKKERKEGRKNPLILNQYHKPVDPQAVHTCVSRR